MRAESPVLESGLRLSLLGQAARLLHSHWPWGLHAMFRRDTRSYFCQVRWCGIVVVSDGKSGDFIARSVAGNPFAPDEVTRRLAERDDGGGAIEADIDAEGQGEAA